MYEDQARRRWPGEAAGQALARGSGMEPGPAGRMGPAADIGADWQVMTDRILGSDRAAQTEVLYQIVRRFQSTPGTVRPENIIPRPLVSSVVRTGINNGVSPITWVFETLSVVTGVSAQVYPSEQGDGIQNWRININAGSDGGSIIGTPTNRATLGALANIPAVETGIPRALQPTSGTSDNNWNGFLEGIGLIGPCDVHVTLYGVSLWLNGGQIR